MSECVSECYDLTLHFLRIEEPEGLRIMTCGSSTQGVVCWLQKPKLYKQTQAATKRGSTLTYLTSLSTNDEAADGADGCTILSTVPQQ